MTTTTPSHPAVVASPATGKLIGLSVASKATILGLGLYGVSMFLAVLSTLISGASFMTVFFAASLAVVVVLSGLVRRYGAWALVLTALLLLLNLAGSGRYMVLGLPYPASFFDFTISLFSVLGSLIALGGAVVALVARRRRSTRSILTRTERTAAGAFIAALAVLTVISGVLTLGSRDQVSAAAKAGTRSVEIKATKFVQERIEVRAGEPARLVVRNGDPGMHSFTIYALETDVVIAPRSERLIELGQVPPGEYTYVCKLFGHEQTMKGTLVAVP